MVALLVGAAAFTGCSSAVHGQVHPLATEERAAGAGVTLFAAGSRHDAPILVGTTLDGKRASLLGASTHQIVVLNVWASWCAPCRDESPMLAAMAKRLSGTDVRFIGIDERDATSKARAYAAAIHSNYVHFVDQDGSLLRKLRALPQVGIPSTLVLDRRGRIAARVIGPVTATALQRIVDDLTKEA